MANPARELYEKLNDTAVLPSGQSVLTVRVGDNTISPKGAHTIAEVLTLAAQISLAIKRLSETEDVSAWESFLPGWISAVLLPDVVWSNGVNNATRVIPADSMATLLAFASYLDRVPEENPSKGTVASDSVKQVRSALDDLTDLINADGIQLSPEAKNYVFRLINEIRAVFNADSVDIKWDAVRQIHELQGFLSTLANDFEVSHSDHKLATRLRQIARQVTPILLPVANAIGYVTGMAADMSQITDGLASPVVAVPSPAPTPPSAE